MKCSDINIRDPFVLVENGIYYMYGTRAKNFGGSTAGFDVYTSVDLETWSEPMECFNSEKFGMNYDVNWAPEVHKYKEKYYMFATFTRAYNNLRGTFILVADSPLGPFVPHSKDAVTPRDWECLDGTLYVSRDHKPYIEHTQILDGTICYVQLSDDLTEAIGEPVTMFAASQCPYIDAIWNHTHYVTDGPFLYRTKEDKLLMIWSSFIKEQYAECVVRFETGELGMDFVHLTPILDNDGGHGMIFSNGEKIYLTVHTPNKSGEEHPIFMEIRRNLNNAETDGTCPTVCG